MALYMVLGNYTQQGIEGIRERPQRAERLRKRLEANGCQLKAGYLALGRYDSMWLLEAPDEAAITRVIIGAGMTGVIRTETLRVFDEAETNAIIAAL